MGPKRPFYKSLKCRQSELYLVQLLGIIYTLYYLLSSFLSVDVSTLQVHLVELNTNRTSSLSTVATSVELCTVCMQVSCVCLPNGLTNLLFIYLLLLYSCFMDNERESTLG